MLMLLLFLFSLLMFLKLLFLWLFVEIDLMLFHCCCYWCYFIAVINVVDYVVVVVDVVVGWRCCCYYCSWHCCCHCYFCWNCFKDKISDSNWRVLGFFIGWCSFLLLYLFPTEYGSPDKTRDKSTPLGSVSYLFKLANIVINFQVKEDKSRSSKIVFQQHQVFFSKLIFC